jgi:hypothetical protein
LESVPEARILQRNSPEFRLGAAEFWRIPLRQAPFWNRLLDADAPRWTFRSFICGFSADALRPDPAHDPVVLLGAAANVPVHWLPSASASRMPTALRRPGRSHAVGTVGEGCAQMDCIAPAGNAHTHQRQETSGGIPGYALPRNAGLCRVTWPSSRIELAMLLVLVTI